ncbi:MAG TPA: hypothetical protein VKU01_36300 [Bryobacteraceae bacterium]|nr:hypothetical protein [Bryobacteraceae bacterium]
MPRWHAQERLDFNRIHSLVNAIFAGFTADQLQPHVDVLTGRERNTVLCTICCVADEVAATSTVHAMECNSFLARNCRFFSSAGTLCGESDRSPYLVWLGWKVV